jgi:hypothetical protein
MHCIKGSVATKIGLDATGKRRIHASLPGNAVVHSTVSHFTNDSRNNINDDVDHGNNNSNTVE